MSELSESVIDSLRKYLMVRGRTAEVDAALDQLRRMGYYEIAGQVLWGSKPPIEIRPKGDE